LFFLQEDQLDGVGYDFGEVEVDEACGGHADVVIGVGLLKLNLVVVEVFWRGVFASDVDDDVGLIPVFLQSAADNYGLFVLVGKFA
jgi:hypothetical protein